LQKQSLTTLNDFAYNNKLVAITRNCVPSFSLFPIEYQACVVAVAYNSGNIWNRNNVANTFWKDAESGNWSAAANELRRLGTIQNSLNRNTVAGLLDNATTRLTAEPPMLAGCDMGAIFSIASNEESIGPVAASTSTLSGVAATVAAPANTSIDLPQVSAPDPIPAVQPQDGIHYYAVLNTDTGDVVARGLSKSGNAVDSGLLLAPNTNYTLFVLDVAGQDYGYLSFTTPASGQAVGLPPIVVGPKGQTTNADGLSPIADFILGLDPDSQVVPGMTNLAPLEQGLIGSKSLVSTTGVIASLPLQGDARAVALTGSTTNTAQQTAYVATGSYGLAIVEASNFQKPTTLSQLKLTGTATDVAVDTTLNLAAVVDGSGGLQIVNVADPTNPKLVQTIPIDATRVQVIDGVAYANNGGAIDAFDLATGAGVQAPVNGATITAIARDGAMLYTMDSSNTLHVIDTSSGAMVLDGSVTLPTVGSGLFAGNGVVYVGTGTNNGRNGGYLTVDVSNPAAPTLIEGVDAANIAGAALALNGSGLGVSVQEHRARKCRGCPRHLEPEQDGSIHHPLHAAVTAL
jgi:hypothetical protein